MKKTRDWMAALAGVLFLSLTGCQLAETGTAQEGEGIFVGLFLTSECLVDSPLVEEDGRIYGQIEGTLTDETEDAHEDSIRCVFPGIEGIGFYQMAVRYGEEPLDYCMVPDQDGALQERDTAINIGRDGIDQEIAMQGTLIVSSEADRYPAYANKLYQRSDRELYLIPEESPLGAWHIPENDSVSQTYQETVIKDQEKRATTVELTITAIPPIEKVVWTQLDQNHHITARAEYAPEDIPDTLIPEASTTYMIVEHFHKGKTIPDTREIINPETEAITTLSLQTEGYYLAQDTEIRWEV